MNINEIKTDIFNQISKTYRTINPTLSDVLTLDSLTGREADALEIQLKKIKKEHVGYLIFTIISCVALTTFSIFEIVRLSHISYSHGFLTIATLSFLIFTFRSRMFIKTIENQIFLHRLLNKIDDK